MEDDDEFGDLYTDVLRPFSSSASSLQPEEASPSTFPTLNRPIGHNNLSNGDEDMLCGSVSTNFTGSNQAINQIPLAAPHRQESNLGTVVTDGSIPNLTPINAFEDRPNRATEDLGVDLKNSSFPVQINHSRVIKSGDFSLGAAGDENGTFPDQKDDGESNTRTRDEETDEKDGQFVLKDQNFGIEDNNGGMGDLGSEAIIPGLDAGPSIHGSSDKGKESQEISNATRRDDGSGEADGWDSDSEDDLQIVLNDNNHGPMGNDRSAMMGSDDEDEDGDLVIVADDGAVHQSTEEQDWGENGGPTADGEGKDTAEAGKTNGAAGVAPKGVYGNYSYHPFHSQFKYVRPGLPGGPPVASGGPAGQVRPPANMSAFPGRGRGEWRPSGMKGPSGMQKGFHPGFWGNNMSGRGGGLEFTLPSHKSIFDVEPDSFEDKPWKYPGVDISDFFNFGLNEESWKEYRKQLEQLRLESTMQSKIHVYESGRAEQEYDPDLPPELAAASGIHDPSAENPNNSKGDVGQIDQAKGTARVQLPLPIGRAIQVETGYGERLPSVDTRLPRMRDSDAVIEIVLQDTQDDDTSAGKEGLDVQDKDMPGEDDKTNVVEEDNAVVENEYSDGSPQSYDGKQGGGVAKRSPSTNSFPDDMPAEERDKSLPPETPREDRPDSRGHTPAYSAEKVDAYDGERRNTEKAHERSPCLSQSENTFDKKSVDDQLEESIESIERKHILQPQSPAHTREKSFEEGTTPDEGLVPTNKKSGKEKVESKDKRKMQTMRKTKQTSRVEPPVMKEDDGSDVKASRSSETSKATGSSRDHLKWREGVDEEVIQDGRPGHPGDLKRHRVEDELSFRRKDREGRLDAERNYMLGKRREGSYDRDWDPYAVNPLHVRSESSDRRRERDYSDVIWQRQDEDPYGRRIRVEDPRKHERVDEMVTRHRGKVRENEKVEKDNHLHSRKLLENGGWRGYHEKGVGLRYREKDDHLRSRYENIDDLHARRRKEDEHVRRDHIEKEEMLHAHRESSSRQKRERDGVFDPRRRDDQSRRDVTDDYHSVRHKDEGLLQRERPERQREKDEWYRSKQYDEDTLSRRDREVGHGAPRSGRTMEEKAWAGRSRTREEYKGYDKDHKYKDTTRPGEKLKRKDRGEDESSLRYKGSEDVYTGGIQMNEEKRPRQERSSTLQERSSTLQERSSTRNDRTVRASESQRVHEKKYKDTYKKLKDTEGSHHSTSGISKKHQDDKSGRNDTAGMTGAGEHVTAENKISGQHLPVGEQGGDASSGDEQQISNRGRSKLERWTSHKERDYDISKKSLPSLQVKEMNKNSNGHSGISNNAPDDPIIKVDADMRPTEGKEAGAEGKPAEDPHLDTVLKLKKRSERFKVPLTSEKDVPVNKKVETEAPTSAQTETVANSEVKLERPPRKRRWVSN